MTHAGVIYIIESPKSVYVGEASCENFTNRLRQHRRAIEIYGKLTGGNITPEIKIIEELPIGVTKQDRIIAEKKWMDYFSKYKKVINENPLEVRPETRKKIGNFHRGKKVSSDTKFKISLSRRGEKCPNSKLNDNQINEIRKLLSSGLSLRKTAKLFNVSSSTISDIKKGRCWGWLIQK